MRYYYKKPKTFLSNYGQIYKCNHPVYSSCTLYIIRNKGLAVIQQRFNPEIKSTYWTEIDSYLINALYLHPKFKEYFDNKANVCMDGIYPTVTVRQIMWALKLKPLPKERWETCFDRSII